MEASSSDLLLKWQSYLTNISSNLMELSDQTEYQMIKSKAQDSEKGYIGLTREKAVKCVESLGALWRYFAILSEVVEKAASMNEKQSFLYNADGDIRKLLEETQIVVDTEHVDINKRNLLGNEIDEKKAVPAELLKFMQESFENTCKDITEISQSEKVIGERLSNIKNEILRLNSAAKAIGINNFPGFDINATAEFERDPLKGMQELDKVVYNIEKYRASIKSVQEEYNGVAKNLEGVKCMVAELRNISEKSKIAAEESAKIICIRRSIMPVISEEVIKSLEDWVIVLEKKLSEGSIKAVKVGVSKLQQECLTKLQTEKENYSINSGDYNEWQDLSGQFKALLAKAEILKAKGMTVDDSLWELIDKTNSALNARPVNLCSCRELIEKLMIIL